MDSIIWVMGEEVAVGKDLAKESLPAKVGKDGRVMATLVQTLVHPKTVSGPVSHGFLLKIVD